jgi:hypothetical protein
MLTSAASAQESAAPSERLREASESLQIEVSDLVESRDPALCAELLDRIRGDANWTLAPTAVSDSLDSASLAPYKAACPTLPLDEWSAPPWGIAYVATRGFRVYDLPADARMLGNGRRFILYAESYFSAQEKERFRDRPDIYPWAGYASAGDRGIYSVVDMTSCERTIELPVHGGYDHRVQRNTNHFSEPFLHGGELYVYDFHDYAEADKHYAGMEAWHFVDQRAVQQVCVFDSADTRQLLNASRSPTVRP